MRKISQLLFVLTFVFILFIPAVQADSQLQIEYRFGIDNKVSPSQLVPVTVTITNNGSDFSGEFVYDNVEMYAGGSGVVLPFEVNTGESVNVKFYINGVGDYIDPSIIKDRTHVYEGTVEDGDEVSVSYPNLQSPSMLHYEIKRMLIISEDATAKESIDAYRDPILRNLNVTQVQTNAVDELVNHVKDLAVFSIVYIDAKAANSLSEEQVQLLEQWTRQGGTLFLSGQIDKATLPSLLTFSSTNAEVENSSTKPTVLADGTIVAQMDYSSGHVIHASTGYENKVFAKDTIVEKMISTSVKNTSSTEYMSNQAYKASDWVSQNGYFDTFYYNTSFIILFLIIYIIVVGPLLYIVLKKKDRREKMWLYIPLIAFVTTIVLFIFGASDRMLKPQSQSMELVELNGSGDAHIHSAYSFVSNKHGDYYVKTNSDTSIAAYFEGMNANSNTIHDKALLRMSDEEQTLMLRNVPYWSVQGAVTTQFKEQLGRIHGDLQLSNGLLTGTIENTLQVDFDRLFLISGKNIVEFGALKANTILEVNNEVGFTVLSKPVYKEEYMDIASVTALNDKEKMHEQKINSIINTVIHTSEDSKPYLIGITDQSLSDTALTVEHSKKALTVITDRPNIQVKFDGPFTLRSTDYDVAFLNDDANYYAEVYFEDGKVLGSLQQGEHTLQYTLPKGVVPENTIWSELEVKHSRNELHVTIYNAKTKGYEDVSNNAWKPTTNISDYIQNDTLQFRLSTNEQYYGTLLEMPTFILKGEAQHD